MRSPSLYVDVIKNLIIKTRQNEINVQKYFHRVKSILMMVKV